MNMKYVLLFSLFVVVIQSYSGTGVSRWLYKDYNPSYNSFLNENPALREMLSNAFSDYKNFLEKDAKEKLFECLANTESTLKNPASECEFLKQYWLAEDKKNTSIEQYKIFERLAEDVEIAQGYKYSSKEYQKNSIKYQKLSEESQKKSEEYQEKSLKYEKLSKEAQEKSKEHQGEIKDYWEDNSKDCQYKSEKYQKRSKKHQEKSIDYEEESKKSQELSKKYQDESDTIIKDILNKSSSEN